VQNAAFCLLQTLSELNEKQAKNSLSLSFLRNKSLFSATNVPKFLIATIALKIIGRKLCLFFAPVSRIAPLRNGVPPQ
jgi:hypothetical protein